MQNKFVNNWRSFTKDNSALLKRFQSLALLIEPYLAVDGFRINHYKYKNIHPLIKASHTVQTPLVKVKVVLRSVVQSVFL